MSYPSKLGQYLKANHPDATESQCLATYSQEAGFQLEWDNSLGEKPTPEQVEAWQPVLASPDAKPAPSLEIREYKTLESLLDEANTLEQVKEVFRTYLHLQQRTGSAQNQGELK